MDEHLHLSREEVHRSMREKTVTLPSRDKMLEGLLQIDDDKYLQETMYAALLQRARMMVTARSIALLIMNLIQMHLADMHPAEALMFGSNVIDVLIDDDEVADKAKNLLQEELAGDQEIIIPEYEVILDHIDPVRKSYAATFQTPSIIQRCMRRLCGWILSDS